MKIRKVVPDIHAKVSALLRHSFPGSSYEERLVDNLHSNNRPLHEWVCIHTNKVIAYIAFSNAYDGVGVCGFHLAPLVVKPEFQRRGIGSELLHFSLRQNAIKEKTLFVMGDPVFYKKFGFEPCVVPTSPFKQKKACFLSMRNTSSDQFTVGYEPEFTKVKK